MRSPFSPLHLILFIIALSVMLALVQVGLLTIAFEKLALSSESAFMLLFVSLFGSAINLPLFSVQSEPMPEEMIKRWQGLLKLPEQPFTGKTIIAVNVGGCFIPIMFSFYLFQHSTLTVLPCLIAISVVTLVSRLASRPIPGLGVGMPIFVAPVTAAVTSVLIAPEQSAPLAYISGTLGVLIGADILRLHNIRQMGTPFASIGGAGTFDGIFITGLVAVLLA